MLAWTDYPEGVRDEPLSDRVQAQGHAAAEEVLPLLLEWVELGAVYVAQQTLQADAAEEGAPTHHLERLLPVSYTHLTLPTTPYV